MEPADWLQYSVPYAGIYRGMAIVAANGVDTLPKYCLAISGGLLLTAVAMNIIRVRIHTNSKPFPQNSSRCIRLSALLRQAHHAV